MAKLTNADAINFGTVADGNITISHATINALDETNGQTGGDDSALVYTGPLTTSRTLVEKDPITIPANDIEINIVPGDLQDDFLQKALNSYIDDLNGPAGFGKFRIKLLSDATTEISDSGYSAQYFNLNVSASSSS